MRETTSEQATHLSGKSLGILSECSEARRFYADLTAREIYKQVREIEFSDNYVHIVFFGGVKVNLPFRTQESDLFEALDAMRELGEEILSECA